MGVTRTVSAHGNQQDKPKKGDKVTIEYTGYLYDDSKATNAYRGKKFDSSVERGDFKTAIGVGDVIPGWDEGCLTMSKGDMCKLTLAPQKGYGAQGFPAWGIKPNATLAFEIEILKVNGQ